MTKGMRRSRVLLSLVLIISMLNMSSCVLMGYGKDHVTADDVQDMIDKGMNGNITVEGGDNYHITVNGVDNVNATAAKALLSAVSINAVFKTSAYGSVYQPGTASVKEKTAIGSGVIYKLDKNHGDAYIITNYHVVYHSQANTENGISNNIKVYLFGQESEEYAIPATYVGGAMSYDIAVLKIDGSRILAESNAMAVSLGDSDSVAVLDRAIAIGNPENMGISATVGHINVDSEYITIDGADGVTSIKIRVMRMDTAVNNGNSGGGLFNKNGELIGIVNARLNNTDNLSYAIPANFVRSVADNIIYYCDGTDLENVYRCYLGITMNAHRLYTVYDEERGVVLKREEVSVATVERNGLAGGVLKVGDIINTITVDGKAHTINRMYLVTESLIDARAGSVVIINITRDGVAMDVTVTVPDTALNKIK